MLATLLAEDSPAAKAALRRWGAGLEDARRHSRLGRALLRGMLDEATGVAAEAWRIVTEPSGRPVAVDGFGNPGPSVSLSHSGGWVTAAVSPLASTGISIGIDVEAHRRARDFEGIARMAFGAAECIRAGAGQTEFYRVWTLREAMAKAMGDGIARVADRRDRAAEGPATGAWVVETEGAPWLLFHSLPHPGLSLALAARGWSGTAVEPVWWRPPREG